MSEFKVRLGDMFYVPFSEEDGIVLAGKTGYISTKDDFSHITDLHMFSGISYLGNIFEMLPHRLLMEVPGIEDSADLTWKGLDT